MRHTRTAALVLVATAMAMAGTVLVARPAQDRATAEAERLVVFETFNRPG